MGAASAALRGRGYGSGAVEAVLMGQRGQAGPQEITEPYVLLCLGDT